MTETATRAVQDAYALVHSLVRRLFEGKPVAEAALEEHAKDPDGPHQNEDLRIQLQRANAAADPQLVEAARRLMEAVDPDGTKDGKYRLDLRGAQVGSVGDHNTNTITFGAPPAQS